MINSKRIRNTCNDKWNC